jgi:hypothetical protein
VVSGFDDSSFLRVALVVDPCPGCFAGTETGERTRPCAPSRRTIQDEQELNAKGHQRAVSEEDNDRTRAAQVRNENGIFHATVTARQLLSSQGFFLANFEPIQDSLTEIFIY